LHSQQAVYLLCVYRQISDLLIRIEHLQVESSVQDDFNVALYEQLRAQFAVAGKSTLS
jgi:hypothetical protein